MMHVLRKKRKKKKDFKLKMLKMLISLDISLNALHRLVLNTSWHTDNMDN